MAGRKRLQIEASEKTQEKIEDIKLLSGFTENTDVVRTAISLLHQYFTEEEGGGKLYVEAKDGTKTRLKVLF